MKNFTDSLIKDYSTNRLDTVLLEDRQMLLFDTKEDGSLEYSDSLRFTEFDFDSKQIDYLSYEDFQNRLKKRLDNGNNTVKVKYLLEFMQSLTGKLLHKNHLVQLQYLINGFNLELPVWVENNHLEFISSDHWGLHRGDHGEQKPDFTDSVFTYDTKTYRTFTSMSAANTYDFHKTYFVVAACLEEGKYYYRYKFVNQDGVYSKPLTLDEVPEVYKESLQKIKLPNKITMLYFHDIKDLTDDQVANLDTIKYSFVTYKMVN